MTGADHHSRDRPGDGSAQTTDEQLRELLAKALAPPPVQPSMQEMDALQAVVASARAGHEPTVANGGRWTALWRPSHWRRRAAIPVLATVMVLGSGGVAVALARPVLPSPLRAAARAVGLPVDSQRLADARAQLARLEAAMASGPLTAARQAQLRKEADALQAALARLDPSERQMVAPSARGALSRADRALQLPAAPPPGSSSSSPPGSPPSSSPPGSTTTTSRPVHATASTTMSTPAGSSTTVPIRPTSPPRPMPTTTTTLRRPASAQP